MSEKKDNIYLYLWEELNTIYVGRTVNPKGRHWAHKHRETEPTYKFSSEHHVEHPKMIIIENDLTIEEGIEREKYWIKEYRENSPYRVLNKLDGGQTGSSRPVYTEEELKEHKKKYYEQNKEWLLALQRVYYHSHKKEIKEKRKNYFKAYNDSHKEENKKYYEAHKKEIKEYKQKYRETHKEKISNELKEWRESHKDEIKTYREIHKDELRAKKKAYREAHKEEIKKYNKEYRERQKLKKV